MKLAHPEVEYRLNSLQGMLFASCHLGAWCFNPAGSLYLSTSPHQEEYLYFMQVGGCLEHALAKMDRPGQPVILIGGLNLGWITEWVHMQNGGHLLIVLGPLYMQGRSVDESLHLLLEKGLDASRQQAYVQALQDVPYVPVDTFRHFSCMLHYTCYEENISGDDILYESVQTEAAPEPEKPSGLSVRENDFLRMVAHERLMLQHLQEGTVPGSGANDYSGELQDFHLRDMLRQAKDNLIIFTALCTRTAINNGVSLYVAKTRESEWIHRIESVRSIGSISALTQKMFDEFQKLILEVAETAVLSKAVRDARDYIRSNYTKPLSAEAVARHCGYTEYYLTRKFTKETGMKLTDYIRSVRLDAAKVMLLTSQKDIQEISEELQFGSRSYFDRVFRQETGMSPRRFRETMGRIGRQ